MARRLVLVALAAQLAACAAVYSPVPMGENPVAVQPENWDGLWTAPGIGLVVRTVNAEQGLLDVLLIDGSSTESHQLQLRQSGGWLFASTQADEDEADGEVDADAAATGEADGEDGSHEGGDGDQPAIVSDPRPWVFFRVVNKGDTLVIWNAHTDRFRRAVERGHLPGRVAEEEDGDPVYLGALTPAHYRVITESTQGVLMDWDEPVVLVRSAPVPAN